MNIDNIVKELEKLRKADDHGYVADGADDVTHCECDYCLDVLTHNAAVDDCITKIKEMTKNG